MNEDNRMNDLISRQAAIREYQEVCKGIKCGECPLLIKVNTEKGSHLITDCKLEAFLHDLPSAQPEQKHGRWIESTELSEQVKGKKFCSNCGKAQYAIEITDKTIQIKSGTSKFCPECGARMDGGKEDE